jgi:16S rRNA (cytosine967-C5)-methyltransferase
LAKNRATNSRLIAANVIKSVIADHRSLDNALENVIPSTLSSQDKAFVQAMSYGVLRWHEKLNFILNKLLKKPFRNKDRDLQALALLGLYQICYSRVKPHAAVSETVSATKKSGKSWAAATINAVLRNYLRNREELDQSAEETLAIQTSHPLWLCDAIKKNWPAQQLEILAQNNQQAPMTLRVNRNQTTIDAYIEKLSEHEINGSPHPYASDAISLKNAVEISRLPNFQEGFASVQDAAAQLAAHLLDPQTGDRVLDACAAPGGKSCHLLEYAPKMTELVAIDCDAKRVEKIKENLNRLQLKATLVTADASLTASWWDNKLFDKILLDAPCSATGVIRRHPDIKWLRTKEDIDSLATIQQSLLEALWPLLAPGGTLLYATCSIFKQENEQQLDRFLSNHQEASELPIDAEWGTSCSYGRQIITGENGMDGFYYARLKKELKND